MSSDESRAWASLALGIAAVAALDTLVPVIPRELAGLVGTALGYAIWRLVPPSGRRGPPKYWRGRAHWD